MKKINNKTVTQKILAEFLQKNQSFRQTHQRVRQMESELKKVRDWAQSKIDDGQEPPWAWYQYMKLIETTETILASYQATTENSQQEELHPATHLRLVASTCSQDGAQRHPSETPVRLPM